MAKKQITREMILNAAFELTRREGASALSVRSIARMCDCSTQPIYLSFKGIDEIKDEVYLMTLNYFYDYMLKMVASKKFPEYKAMGMAYVKFAHDESELFKYVFMTTPRVKNSSVDASFSVAVEVIKKTLNVSDETARKLHLEMWIFGHGIATMYITDYLNFDLDTVSDMYKDIYTGIIKNLGVNNGN